MTTVVQQWSQLEIIYCQLIIAYAEAIEEPAPTILQRASAALVRFSRTGYPSLPCKESELAAWIVGGENGWFSMVHAR